MADGDLCEIADVQAWTGSNSPSAETILARLITAASRMVANYCGRSTFSASSYTDTYDGSGREFMLLRQWPVISVESIALLECGAPAVITDSTQFALEAPIPSGSNQRLTLLGFQRFPRGRGNVQVTYTAGYASVPFDVAQATIELVGEAYKRKERIGQTSVAMPNQSTVSFSQADMNASIKSMLQSYRRLVPC